MAPLAGIEPASTLLNRQPRAPCSPEGNEFASPAFALRATAGSLRGMRLACQSKRLGAKTGGMSGTRTRRLPLARRRLSLLSYHPELVPRVGFEPPLRAFNAAL